MKDYAKQAEEDLNIYFDRINRQHHKITSQLVDLKDKYNETIGRIDNEKIAWDALDYHSLESISPRDMGKLVKLQCPIYIISKKFEFNEHVLADLTLGYEGDFVESVNVSDEPLIDNIYSMMKQYNLFEFIGTIVPTPRIKDKMHEGYHSAILIHEVRRVDTPLQLVKPSTKELAITEKFFGNLGENFTLLDFIKYILISELQIKGLDNNPILAECIEAMIFQAFSDGWIVRRNPGTINTLIIGAPGQGKQLLAKIAEVLNPAYEEAETAKITRAGILGAVRFKDGDRISEPGKLPLADRGVFAIQDFGSMEKRTRLEVVDAIQRVMEEGNVIDSSVVKTTHPALTSIHLDMNKFSDLFPGSILSKKPIKDIGLSMPLLSRFDYIVDIKRNTQRQREIAKEMLKSIREISPDKLPLETHQMLRILRVITAYLTTQYAEISFDEIEKYKSEKSDQLFDRYKEYQSYSILGDFFTRSTNSILKFTASSARLNQRKEANEHDLDTALRFVEAKLDYVASLWNEFTRKGKRLKRASRKEARRDWILNTFAGQEVNPKILRQEWAESHSHRFDESAFRRDLDDLAEKSGTGKWKVPEMIPEDLGYSLPPDEEPMDSELKYPAVPGDLDWLYEQMRPDLDGEHDEPEEEISFDDLIECYRECERWHRGSAIEEGVSEDIEAIPDELPPTDHVTDEDIIKGWEEFERSESKTNMEGKSNADQLEMMIDEKVDALFEEPEEEH